MYGLKKMQKSEASHSLNLLAYLNQMKIFKDKDGVYRAYQKMTDGQEFFGEGNSLVEALEDLFKTAYQILGLI